ncbi:MAG: F0F1 ATP synthase subunit A [Deltaproteobacteria bacterium]|nr:F0F1 ATP synthase subunit A [Deltaproteobacteria bacterium]
MEHSATFFSLIPILKNIPVQIVAGGLVTVLLFLVATKIFRELQNPENYVIPHAQLGIVGFFELIVEGALGVLEGILGKEAKYYLPLVGTVFILILFSNLIGLIPGFYSPTTNLNTTIAWASIIFILYNYYGFRAHGVAYLKHFAGPVLWLAPLMLVIEIISHLVRPVSLSLRLFLNMTGDHFVLGIFSNLTHLVIPAIFMALGVFVSLIQAFVFAMLSTIYIALSTAHEH